MPTPISPSRKAEPMSGSLEAQAEGVARRIASEAAHGAWRPVDPAHIARLTEIVQAAKQAGHDAAMREVLDAWHLLTEADEDDAMDVFVEQLGDIAGPVVVEEMKKGPGGTADPPICPVCLGTGIVEEVELDGEGAYETACPEPVHDGQPSPFDTSGDGGEDPF